MESNLWHRQYIASGSRFADHYRHFALAHQKSSDDLAGELGNIDIAIRWYVSQEIWTGVTETADAIFNYLRAKGPWERAIEFDQLALEAAQRLYAIHKDDVHLGLDVVRYQSGSASLYWMRGQRQEAEHLLTDAFTFSHELDDPGALA